VAPCHVVLGWALTLPRSAQRAAPQLVLWNGRGAGTVLSLILLSFHPLISAALCSSPMGGLSLSSVRRQSRVHRAMSCFYLLAGPSMRAGSSGGANRPLRHRASAGSRRDCVLEHAGCVCLRERGRRHSRAVCRARPGLCPPVRVELAAGPYSTCSCACEGNLSRCDRSQQDSVGGDASDVLLQRALVHAELVDLAEHHAHYGRKCLADLVQIL
jgi:hypothetical protein